MQGRFVVVGGSDNGVVHPVSHDRKITPATTYKNSAGVVMRALGYGDLGVTGPLDEHELRLQRSSVGPLVGQRLQSGVRDRGRHKPKT